MQRIRFNHELPLFDVAGTRALEQSAAAALPPHAVMERAGLALARLVLALYPHARSIWIACGPGNNGGDGLEVAMQLRGFGKDAVVTWLGEESAAPQDARASLHRAREAGVVFPDGPPANCDVAVDALLGIGSARALEGRMAELAGVLGALTVPIIAADLPSGLDAMRGTGAAVRATHTLSLFTLKPGLFTAGGRDASGEIWFDDLGVDASQQLPIAFLSQRPEPAVLRHDSHKGTHGDACVVGGAPGMTGAALLAATAAHAGGAGRVFVALLDGGSVSVDTAQPELMFRDVHALDFSAMSVACGCGGGDAVRPLLPRVMATAGRLVLDADALNAIAADTQLQALLKARGRRRRATVMTPHPLEAARLLECTAAQVQADRLAAAAALVDRYACVVVLKGSGTVTAAPGERPRINPTGNGRLATAGTGDVLAGMICARLARGESPAVAARSAVFEHGAMADHWPIAQPLTAGALARNLR